MFVSRMNFVTRLGRPFTIGAAETTTLESAIAVGAVGFFTTLTFETSAFLGSAISALPGPEGYESIRDFSADAAYRYFHTPSPEEKALQCAKH